MLRPGTVLKLGSSHSPNPERSPSLCDGGCAERVKIAEMRRAQARRVAEAVRRDYAELERLVGPEAAERALDDVLTFMDRTEAEHEKAVRAASEK